MPVSRRDLPAGNIAATALFAGFTSTLGAYQMVETAAGSFVIRFEWGTIPVKSVAIDQQGRFITLLLGVPNFSNGAEAFNQAIALVEALARGNRPFLTPPEAFALKDPTNQSLLDRYPRGGRGGSSCRFAGSRRPAVAKRGALHQ